MKFQLPNISEENQTPLVKELLILIEQLIESNEKHKEDIQLLKDEVLILKGQKKRPTFQGSKLDKDTDENEDSNKKKKNSNKSSQTRKSKKNLPIDRDEYVKPDNIPAGSTFKGYQNFNVQELIIKNEVVRYRLERWLTPEGKIITGKLPAFLENRHYGSTLVSFILYQYHHCYVTQPLIVEQLNDWGIIISSGQVDNILSGNKERFHNEKDEILRVGLAYSTYVTVDDSGARHDGKNGVVTHIGNDYFAWFCSTSSKSRLNFITLLNQNIKNFRLDENALSYMEERKLPQVPLMLLQQCPKKEFDTEQSWEAQLCDLQIDSPSHIRIATEGALMGALLDNMPSIEKLVIVSDGAKQFCLFFHALCWVHAERLIHKLIPMNESYAEVVENVRDQVWNLYRQLKAYKLAPCEAHAQAISNEFDVVFQQKTPYITLNQLLDRLYKLKAKLLLVLDIPKIPLHTNDSERDIRGYVKKRKVSGGTRSDIGQQCRDTFMSQAKTCRKLGISFWDYLKDRHGENKIPPLGSLLRFFLNGLSAPTSL